MAQRRPVGSGGSTANVNHNKLLSDLRNQLEEAEQLQQQDLAKMRRRKETAMAEVAMLKEMKAKAIARMEQAARGVEEAQENKIKVDEQLLARQDQLRVLHEEAFDLMGRIRLCVRVRPLLPGETPSAEPHITAVDPNILQVIHGKIELSCECEHIWMNDDSQTDVFDKVVDFVQSALDGYNVAVIAYGQTGSGKTFTMRGEYEELAGVIPRTMDMLFRSIARSNVAGWKVEVGISIFELYLGKCFDLLGGEGRLQFTLHFVDGTADFRELTVIPIVSAQQALDEVNRSDELRSFATTKCSKFSSRGHTITRIKIHGVMVTDGKEYFSSISLVDLAGSERVGQSGVRGAQLKETQYINKSLAQLGVVMRSQLLESDHVPYSSDPLTKALAESLGAGSSKTMFIACIRPNRDAAFESRRTMEFAKQVMMTKIGRAKRGNVDADSLDPLHI